MAGRGGGRDGGRGDYSHGSGVGNNSTNYADSVGTPTGRMNAKTGSTQIAGAPKMVALSDANKTSLHGAGDSPAFKLGFNIGKTPGIPVPHVHMLQTDGANANPGGSQQAGGHGGSQQGKGKPWANFHRGGGGPGARRGGSP